VEFSSKSPNTVFVASDQGVSVSRDLGASWQQLNNGLNPGEHAYRVVTLGNEVFVQGDYGIYRLTSGDSNWMKARWMELENHPESDPLGYVANLDESQHSVASAGKIGESGTVGSPKVRTDPTQARDGKLPAPILVGPEDGRTFSNFPRVTNLQWKAVAGASSYSVEVDFRDPPGWSQTVLKKGIKGTEFSFSFAGKQRGRWRVCAVDNNGHEGEQSAWREFEYTI
jgi:hypothetical protein